MAAGVNEVVILPARADGIEQLADAIIAQGLRKTAAGDYL